MTKDLPAGTLISNRFQLRKQLGVGSLGTSYLAQDQAQDNREIVLTLIEPQLYKRTGFINTFTLLTHHSRTLTHRDFEPIQEVELSPNHFYYTQNFIPGLTLRLWMLETLDFNERLSKGLLYLSRIEESLARLHKVGHYGSLKPENCYIHGQHITLTHNWNTAFIPVSVYKTNPAANRYLTYMAPELKKNGASLSPASDYYTLGVLLHEILMGKPPGKTPLIPSEQSKYYSTQVDTYLASLLHHRPSLRCSDSGTWKKTLRGICSELENIINLNINLSFDEEPSPLETPMANTHSEAEETENSEYIKNFIEQVQSPKAMTQSTTSLAYHRLNELEKNNAPLTATLPKSSQELNNENLEPIDDNDFEISHIMDNEPIPAPIPPKIASDKLPWWIKGVVYLVASSVVGAAILLGVFASTSWK